MLQPQGMGEVVGPEGKGVDVWWHVQAVPLTLPLGISPGANHEPSSGVG